MVTRAELAIPAERPRSQGAQAARTNAPTIDGSIVPRVLGILIIFGSMLSAVAAIQRDLTAVLLCTTALGTLVLLLTTVALRPNYDLFEPFSFVILSALVGTAAKAIYVAFGTSDHVARVLLGQPREALLTGCVFVLIALMALSIGYSLPIPALAVSQSRLLRRRHWDRRVLTPVIGMALLVSVVSLLFWFHRMGIEISALTQLSQKRFISVEGSDYETGLPYATWGVSVAASAFYILLAWRFLGTRRLPLLARVGLPLSGLIALGFPIFKSSRAGLVEVVLVALILQHYLRYGIRYRTLALALPMTLVAFLSVTAVRGIRDIQQAGGRMTIETLLNTTVGGRHFLDVAKTSHIIEAIPDRFPHTNGATLITWIAAPIPRAIWPSKPSLGSGPIIGAEIFGSTGGGVPPGFVAELYMNFGPLGVPVGMFILGALLKALYTTFAAHRRNPNAVILYAVTVIPLSVGLLQTDLSKAVVNVLTGTVPLMLLLRAMGRDRPGPATT